MEMSSSGLGWIVAHPSLAHCLVALGMMAIACGIFRLLGNRHWAWYAQTYTALFFYTREAAQAERALKPTLGEPVTFFWTLWPGHWTAGGARISEWLAPTLVTALVALLLDQGQRTGRDPRRDR